MPAIIQPPYLRFFALLTLLVTLLKNLQHRCDDSHSVVVQSPNHVWLFAIPWTAAHQASLSFSISQSLFDLMSFELVISSVQLLSHVQLFATPWTAAHQASLSITNSWSLLKLISDAIQSSHPLSSPSPAFNLSQHQGLFKWVCSLHQVAKVLEFQLQHQSFQWIFRTDFL